MNHKIRFFTVITLCLSNVIFAQKFVPEDGKCIFFIGQDIEAIGGLDEYNDGYVDHFETPAGVTVYTNFSPGGNSYGHYVKGLDGLKSKADWGDGPSYADLYLQDSTFKNSAIAIGLSFTHGHQKNVAKGKHDHLIKGLAEWVKSTKRPVFLRIGYEFDGWDWNDYQKKHYLKSWKRIHSIFKELKVNNVAFVWQSKGNGSGQDILEEWYPGDDLVDWVGYSYFGSPDEEMLVFARKHNKPVFIAEATPVRETEGLFFNSDLKDEKIAKILWEEWYVPFFNTIKNNSDVIKAFSYINTNWAKRPMWITNALFKHVDSRIQVSKYVTERWKKEMEDPRYLHAEDIEWD